MKSLNDQAQEYYNNLSTDREAIEYLKSRNITGKTAKHFLIGSGTKGSYFEDYITLPIIMQTNLHKADIVSIVGRDFSLTKEIPYLNTKNPIEYAYNNAAMAHSKYVIVTEGIFDCLSLFQSNLNAIATLGVNRFPMRMMDNYNGCRIYIMFDNDTNKAGQKATEVLADRFMHCGAKLVYKCKLPALHENSTDINFLFTAHKNDFKRIITASLQNATRHIKTLNINNGRKLIPKDMEFIRDIDIAALISLTTNTDVPNSGYAYTQIRCPFHQDYSPSFTVYFSSNSFYCFSCGVGGGALQFIMRLKNMSQQDALKFLKENINHEPHI